MEEAGLDPDTNDPGALLFPYPPLAPPPSSSLVAVNGFILLLLLHNFIFFVRVVAIVIKYNSLRDFAL
jgi:hypothetical protein